MHEMNEIKTLKQTDLKSYGVAEQTRVNNIVPKPPGEPFRSFKLKNKKETKEDKRNSVMLNELTIKINSLSVGLIKKNKMRRKASRIVLLIVLLFFIQW